MNLEPLTRDELLCIITESAKLAPKMMVNLFIDYDVYDSDHVIVSISNVFDNHDILTLDAVIEDVNPDRKYDLVKTARKLLKRYSVEPSISCGLLIYHQQWDKLKKFIREVEAEIATGTFLRKMWNFDC